MKGTPTPTIGTPTGAQNSGTVLDIVNYTLVNGATNISTTYTLSGSMSSSTITITFTMLDGSTKVVNSIGI